MALLLGMNSVAVFGADIIDQDNTALSMSIENLRLQNSIAHESTQLADICNISTKEAALINGEVNNLYPTFDDIDIALANLEKKIPTYFKYVQEKVDLHKTYGIDYNKLMLTDFSPENEELRLLHETLELSSISETGDESLATLTNKQKTLYEEREIFDLFFDIYENESKNIAIMDLIESGSKCDQEELAYLLPYTTPFSTNYFSDSKVVTRANPQYFDRTAGRTYAINRATNPNSSAYGIASTWYGVTQDCTNFASQILIAGGIQMHDQYPNEELGWWHRFDPNGYGTINPGPRHFYSATWVNADRFVKFMGTSGNEYTSFYTFSGKLISGDHIAYDGERDGDWNHIGFVCDIGTYNYYSYNDNGVTRTKYYRDFTVAQHTTNYYAWTSSDTNNWEKLDGSASFAIVRRNAVA